MPMEDLFASLSREEILPSGSSMTKKRAPLGLEGYFLGNTSNN